MIDLDPNPKPRKRKIRESDVEAHLVKRVAALGGVAEKFTSPSRRSVPDRIVLWPGGLVHFVECKAPGEKPTPQQARDHEQRRRNGFRVFVVDSKESVEQYIEVSDQ